ncbi:MAG: arsenate reductase (glutaredoxin) [Bacteroidota bacterium]
MAGCGYVCPQCEGVGFTADLLPCNWCNPQTMITVYHNSRCSKSRNALTLLEEKNIDFKFVEYLKTPFTHKELADLIKLIGIKPFDLIRKNEDIFKATYANKQLSDAEWIDVMLAHPTLIERPIVVNGKKAIIARPAEKILEIL